MFETIDGPRKPGLNPKRMVLGAIWIFVIIGLGIYGVNLWRQAQIPEWERQNPPTWIRVGDDGQTAWFMNSKVRKRESEGIVLVLMNARTRGFRGILGGPELHV